MRYRVSLGDFLSPTKALTFTGGKMKIKGFLLTILLIMLTGCSKEPEERTIFAMDTVMTISAYTDQEVIQKAVDRIYELESLFSVGTENSDIYTLNTTGSLTAHTDTTALLNKAVEMSELTEGAFEPTIYPLVKEWGFISKEFKVPDQKTIDSLLLNVDYNNLTISENNISLKNNAEIDLGGIAKGYTSQQLMELFKSEGVASAIVSLGGNVQALGTKPDGSKWRVGIQSPDNDSYIGIIDIADKAVITSGGYQRYFEEKGVAYHHILDPETGYPANSGLKSVTIVSSDGAMADSLSTAIYIMGYEEAVKFWQENTGFDMILVDDNNEIYVTKNIACDFSCEQEFNVIE